MRDSYKKVGVDIELAKRIIDEVKPMIHSTHIPGVMSKIGHFAGLFSLSQEKIEEPVLVSGTDGVGTKLLIANLMQKHDTIGIDLVAMCVNDILTCGAKPLFFLDYLATGKLEKKKMMDIMKGITTGCRMAGCALLGGETAEMPGFYQRGEYDLSGFTVGIVERKRIITGESIEPGDILIGLASSGLHSNGFSLVRKILLKERESNLDENMPFSNHEIGEEILCPTRIYVPSILSLLKKYLIKGIVHITGGGFYENIPRVLPDNKSVNIYANRWPQLPIFKYIQNKGEITDREMFHIFNMGIGLIIIVEKDQQKEILEKLIQLGESAYFIGEVVLQKNSTQKVDIKEC